MIKGQNAEDSRRRARIWNFGTQGFGDMFFNIRDIPEHYQFDLLSEHLPRERRYNLAYFLLGNGLNPKYLSQMVLMTDVRAGVVLSQAYDDSARRHVLDMVKDMDKNKFFKQNKKTFDMIKGYAIYM